VEKKRVWGGGVKGKKAEKLELNCRWGGGGKNEKNAAGKKKRKWCEKVFNERRVDTGPQRNFRVLKMERSKGMEVEKSSAKKKEKTGFGANWGLKKGVQKKAGGSWKKKPREQGSTQG